MAFSDASGQLSFYEFAAPQMSLRFEVQADSNLDRDPTSSWNFLRAVVSSFQVDGFDVLSKPE